MLLIRKLSTNLSTFIRSFGSIYKGTSLQFPQIDLEQVKRRLNLQNDIEHSKTKAYHPQTNGICERFHKTILQEFYQVTFRKKIYSTLDELQKDLDDWLQYYNNDRTHQGKMCCGRTPMDTLDDGKKIWSEKVDSLNKNDSQLVESGAEEMSTLREAHPEGCVDIS